MKYNNSNHVMSYTKLMISILCKTYCIKEVIMKDNKKQVSNSDIIEEIAMRPVDAARLAQSMKDSYDTTLELFTGENEL